MKYAEPYILLLIPAVVIAVVFFCISASGKRKRLLNRILGVNASDPGALQMSYTARRWKYFLYLAAIVLIMCGAARPWLKTVPLPFHNSGRDIMILFDVSKSMRATDLPPSRMEQAKFLLREVISALPGDRFGLIAFAGNAFLSCPLTSDHTALEEYIKELNTDTVPLGGTNIERALRTAERAFSAAESGHCAVLMLTDGDELTGNSQRLINDFKERDIPLIIAGFGDPAAAAPVPDGKGGFMRQSDGTPASSKLNEVSLKKLAEDTGGVYIRSTIGDTGSAAVEAALRRLDSKERNSEKRWQRREEFQWFFAAGFILIFIAGMISEAPGRNSRRINSSIFIACALFAALTVPGAEKSSTDEPVLPQDALQLYNLALKRQENNDPSALKLYEEVIRKSANNSELQSRAMHNSGVGFHRQGRTMISVAQQKVAQQQLDNALQELDKAKKELDTGNEFYSQVLALDSGENRRAAVNMRQLELDRQQLEKLKKQIEELKAQQQKAQQQAQNAAQQNKQNQQNQQQKPSQDSRQNSQQNQQQQIRNAAQAAKELADKSAQMNQEKLRQDANTARKELEEAAKKQSAGANKDEIQKHLDKAVEALGKPQDDKKKDDGRKGGKQDKKADDKKDNAADRQAAERAEAERREKEKKQAGEQQLQMLNDEADKMRQLLRSRNNPGRMPARVEKDW
ncbi:MAG: VWA domain-containing protein [Lentisphaerae bacterium]|nr:VWA domain-containing protein [Lentisphaerota bacterium]